MNRLTELFFGHLEMTSINKETRGELTKKYSSLIFNIPAGHEDSSSETEFIVTINNCREYLNILRTASTTLQLKN